MKNRSEMTSTPSGGAKCTSIVVVVPAPVHAAIRQLYGQTSFRLALSRVFPSSHVSPRLKSTIPLPQPAGGVAVGGAVGTSEPVGDGVGLAPAIGHPLRALVTALRISSTVIC